MWPEDEVLRHARLRLPAGASRADWLAARRHSIGGSEALAVVGCNPYLTAYELWLLKTGRWTGPRENKKMQAGTRLEPVIAEMFCEESRLQVAVSGMWQSLTMPWCTANPDRFTSDGGGLECKASFGFGGSWIWSRGPADHAVGQAQWYMHVTGLKHWYVAVLIDGWDLRWWKVLRDQKLIDALVDGVARFWHDFVLTDEPPPVDGQGSTAETLRSVYGYSYASNSQVEVPGLTQWRDMRRLLKDAVKEVTTELDGVENKIKAALGDAEIGTEEGRPIMAWRSRGSRAIRHLEEL